jgi:hypothetical protein
MRMRLSAVLRTGILLADVLIVPVALLPQTPDVQPKEMLGMPARTSPAEYQAQGKAGSVSIGAEFMTHSVPTPQAIYATDDYVVVETGLFGPPDAHIKLSMSDFSLRINDKKASLKSEHYEIVFKSLRDPEWEPPEAKQSKTSIGNNNLGGAPQSDSPPPTPKMPLDLRRTMEQRVQRAALLEGDRILPQAGLLFFEFRGKAKSIRSVELIYDGPAGKATLTLQP